MQFDRIGSRWFTCAVLLVAGAALAQKDLPKTSIEVFDFSIPESVSVENFDPAQELQLELVSRLEKSANFQPMVFSRRSSPIQLALSDRRLQLDQTRPPFNAPSSSSWRAVDVGSILKVEYALAGTIDAYTYDKAKHAGSLVVAVDVFDVAGNKIAVSAAATGEGRGTADMDEVAVMRRAVNDVATKIMAQVSGPLGVQTSILEKSGRKPGTVPVKLTRTAFAASAIGIALAFILLRNR